MCTTDNVVDVVAALILKDGKFMICRRPPHKARGGLYEFVGGKVEKGESFPEALVRECREELAVNVTVRDEFMSVIHKYPDITICLTVYECALGNEQPKMLEHTDIRFILPEEIPLYEFCPADKDILEKIIEKYGR